MNEFDFEELVAEMLGVRDERQKKLRGNLIEKGPMVIA